jgi:hypothetical protein
MRAFPYAIVTVLFTRSTRAGFDVCVVLSIVIRVTRFPFQSLTVVGLQNLDPNDVASLVVVQ